MYPNKTQTLGEVIQAIRQSQQKNMRDFAAELGVSQNMISLWERDLSDIDTERIQAWFADERPWVAEMAIEIQVIKFRQLLLALRPSVLS